MITRPWTTLLLAVFLAAQAVAQDSPPPTTPPADDAQGSHRYYRGGGNGEGRFGPPGRDRRGGGMFEAWMKSLKERDPQEYERLQDLREKDPEALRNALRKRLQEEHMQRILDEDEILGKILSKLTEEERAYLLSKSGFLGGRPSGPHGQRTPEPGRREGEQKLRELAAAFHQASDPARRDALENELRQHIAALHDQEEAQRAKFLAKLEQQVDSMRNYMEQRQTDRIRLIERRLESVLSTSSPPSKRP